MTFVHRFPYAISSLNRSLTLFDRNGIIGTDKEYVLVLFRLELISIDDPGLVITHLEKLGIGLGAASAPLA
jgi:hypothetical protein